MNIASWLAAAGHERPAAPALLDGEVVVADYAGFALRAAGIAGDLATRHGVRPGDRVAILGPNRLDYLVAIFATWWSGAVVVPVNAKLHPREVAGIVADAGARVLLTVDEMHGLREHVAPDTSIVSLADLRADASPSPLVHRSDSDVAWIFYTSGTTGPPKGAMLTHGNLVAASLSYLADVAPVAAGDHYMYAAPISHGAGLYAPIHVRMGARHVFPTGVKGFDPAEVLRLGEALGDVTLFAAPTMVRRLVKSVRDTGATGSGLRTVVYGGGPMYLSDIQDALETFGPRFVQIYGQGESPMTVTSLSKEQHVGDGTEPHLCRLRSVGTPHSPVSVRIVRLDGETADVGEIGEIEVSGPTVMAGYWNSPAATAATLRDGWLRTGDLGSFDHDGFLTLGGRSKEVIITGGSNVYPREVEDVLMQHPRVDETAVIGFPDEEWGEVVVAFVTPTSAGMPQPEELDAHCLDHLARFKRPKRYVVVDSLPKNANGKILKTQLMDRLNSDVLSSATSRK
jgi:acyl-CoA synthetase (AMP-forming)/AMP-acid ligase II